MTTPYGVCVHCGEPRKSDGYCEDACELYVGSIQPVTVDMLAREASSRCLD